MGEQRRHGNKKLINEKRQRYRTMSVTSSHARPPKAIEQGYVGNLTSDQVNKLRQAWKALLAFCGHDDTYLRANNLLSCFTCVLSDTEKYSRSKFREAWWNGTQSFHPDNLLLRYLRARKWDVEKSISMMVNAIKWRIDFDVEQVIRNGEYNISDYEMFSGKGYIYGFDKEGHVVCYVHAALHITAKRDIEQSKKFTIWQMETARVMAPAPYDKASIVFNMQGYTMANADTQFLRFFVTVLEAYYPESLHRVFVVSAPVVFNALWVLVSPWLDPVVRKKIIFLKKPKQLLAYIDADQLVDKLGGSSGFKFHYTRGERNVDDARLDDVDTRNKLMEEIWETRDLFEEATRTWASMKECPERAALAGKLMQQWIKLDPYVRARSWYDRYGVVREEDWAVNFKWLQLPKSNGINPEESDDSSEYESSASFESAENIDDQMPDVFRSETMLDVKASDDIDDLD